MTVVIQKFDSEVLYKLLREFPGYSAVVTSRPEILRWGAADALAFLSPTETLTIWARVATFARWSCPILRAPRR
jgi:hypothetical protein